MRVILLLLMCLMLTGCDAKDATGLNIDLSQLNWQTAAIIILALLVSPGKIVSSLSEQLGKVPGIEKILRLIGLIRTSDGSPNQLSPAETLEALVAIVNRMPPSSLRDEIAKLLTKAATPQETADES